ncbi:hypothetical protein BGZ63DRAFT_325107, partial [Mariannaea sp. PMI_226]
ADLAEFDKPVTDATISRFNHIHSQLEKPLLAYICSKDSRKYRPIALRLMVLGRSEDDAKPCIVVLCPEQQSKRVIKFFDRDSVQTLCRPEDNTVPSFEVVVLGRPPQVKQADDDTEVLVPSVNSIDTIIAETFCGAPIVIRRASSVEKRCTFGGIIRTVWLNGDIKLYGLTVGHPLLDDSADDHSTELEKAECSNEGSYNLSDSSSEAYTDDSVDKQPDIQSQALLPIRESQSALANAHVSWTGTEMSKIGSISKDLPKYSPATTDMKDSAPHKFYDWALIDMTYYKPNRIPQKKSSKGGISEYRALNTRDLVMPASLPSKSKKRQSVILMTGSGGLKRGSLSALPSRLLLGPGKEFVDARILNLDGDNQILDGDSGSWAVNETTFEVYGYIVAADTFGGGYVISLSEAFQNIRDTLRCNSVDLATTFDI